MSTYGKRLDRQAQDLAYTIYLYFKAKTENRNSTEYKKNMKLIPTVAEATGLPEKIVLKIVMDKTSKTDEDNQNTLTPSRYLILGNLTKCDIRRRVILFYSQYKKAPTLKALHTTFINENVLICTTTYLKRFLSENGFKYINCKSSKRILMERGSLESTRWEYLQYLNIYRESGKPIIYVGETYISATKKATEENPDIFQSGRDREGGFIVLHAADEKGFLNDVKFVMYTKYNRKHYFIDMNAVNFTWWIKEKLLPNLPPHSVIVMNNTNYNSDTIKPTYRNPKIDVENWLRKHDVPFEANMNKCDLLALIDNHQFSGDSALNEMMKSDGHEVLRIPSIHADLNPIEWVWRKMKSQFWSEEQLTFHSDTKKGIVEQALLEVPQTDWQEGHEKVKSIELEFFHHHVNIEQTTDEMLEKIQSSEISLEEEDEDSDSNDEMEISEGEN